MFFFWIETRSKQYLENFHLFKKMQKEKKTPNLKILMMVFVDDGLIEDGRWTIRMTERSECSTLADSNDIRE